MEGFFTCIILIGSGITLFAFFLLLAEKHRMHDYRTDIKQKKEDLINVIEDAEELIFEMNKFSDYVVTQLEEKHKSIEEALNDADLKIEELNSLTASDASQKEDKPSEYNKEVIDKILKEEQINIHSYDSPKTHRITSHKKGKVLTFDSKRSEIIKLAKSGLDSTEIARLLNCGKGEIELISRIGR